MNLDLNLRTSKNIQHYFGVDFGGGSIVQVVIPSHQHRVQIVHSKKLFSILKSNENFSIMMQDNKKRKNQSE